MKVRDRIRSRRRVRSVIRECRSGFVEVGDVQARLRAVLGLPELDPQEIGEFIDRTPLHKTLKDEAAFASEVDRLTEWFLGIANAQLTPGLLFEIERSSAPTARELKGE